MGETHEIPHHNLADFEPWLGYATTGILPYKCNGALHSSHFADSPLPPIQVTQILLTGSLKLKPSPAMQFCSVSP